MLFYLLSCNLFLQAAKLKWTVVTFKASLVNPQSPMVKNGAPRKPTLPKGPGKSVGCALSEGSSELKWIETGCEVAGCTSKTRCLKTKEFSSLPSLRPFFWEAFWVKWVLLIGALVAVIVGWLWLNALRVHWWKWIHISRSLKMEIVGSAREENTVAFPCLPNEVLLVLKITGREWTVDLTRPHYKWFIELEFRLVKYWNTLCLCTYVLFFSLHQHAYVWICFSWSPRSPKVVKLPPARPAPQPALAARTVEPSLEQRSRWNTVGNEETYGHNYCEISEADIRPPRNVDQFETSKRCWLFKEMTYCCTEKFCVQVDRISWKHLTV